MIVVSHELASARDVANRVLFMDEGRVVEDGPPDQVLINPTTDTPPPFRSPGSRAIRATMRSDKDAFRKVETGYRTGPVAMAQGLGSTPVRYVDS